jgi:hypothetical protein
LCDHRPIELIKEAALSHPRLVNNVLAADRVCVAEIINKVIIKINTVLVASVALASG